MQQLVTICFTIKNTKEERNKIIKYMNYYFSIPIQETYNLLHTQYSAKQRFWRIVITIELLVYLLVLLTMVTTLVFIANSI